MTQLVSLLRVLFGAFPNTRVTEENIAAYTIVLRDVPLMELEQVIMDIVKQPGDFVPTAGNVLEKWRESRGMPSPKRAAMAWNEVLDALKVQPAAKLDDPIAKLALKHVGGIWEVRHSEKPYALRAQFLAAYSSFAEAEAERMRKDLGLLLTDKEQS